MLLLPPSSEMLVLKTGSVPPIPIPAGVFTPLSHPGTFCLSVVGLTLFSALPLPVCGGTLGNLLLHHVLEAGSPHGLIKQQ